jgi:hypothetical protein
LRLGTPALEEGATFVDLSKLKPSDWLVGGGTLVFLIAMFLPWYKVDISFVDASSNGWDYFLFGIIPLLLLIAVTVALVLPKVMDGINVPETVGPMPKVQAALIAAGIAAVLVLLRLLLKDDGGVDEAEDFIDRGIGLFLAFLAAAAATAGAFMKFQGKEELGGGSSSSTPPTPF